MNTLEEALECSRGDQVGSHEPSLLGHRVNAFLPVWFLINWEGQPKYAGSNSRACKDAPNRMRKAK